MPDDRSNLSDRTLAAIYVSGIVALCAVGAGALVTLEHLRPEGYNSAVQGQLLTILVPTIAVIVSLLKSVQNGQRLEHLHECTHRIENVVETQVGKQESRNVEQEVHNVEQRCDNAVQRSDNQAQRRNNESRKDQS